MWWQTVAILLILVIVFFLGFFWGRFTGKLESIEIKAKSRNQLGQYYKPPGEVFPLKGPKLFRDATVSDIGALRKQLKRLAKMSDGELKRWATKYLKEKEEPCGGK